jgi:hypothetical protein
LDIASANAEPLEKREAAAVSAKRGSEKRRVAPSFDYSLDYSPIDFRAEPERYRIGKGEQGVLLVEPYKSELLPHWRFRTPEIAQESSAKLLACFEGYKADGDFVGMDMARKFLQMGFTRARRYANHRSGRKWSPDRSEVLPVDADPVKAESARIFYEAYRKAKDDPDYLRMKDEHLAKTADQ